MTIEELRKKRNEARARILSWPSDGWEEEETKYDRLLLLAELKELAVEKKKIVEANTDKARNYVFMDYRPLDELIGDLEDIIKEHEGS